MSESTGKPAPGRYRQADGTSQASPDSALHISENARWRWRNGADDGGGHTNRQAGREWRVIRPEPGNLAARLESFGRCWCEGDFTTGIAPMRTLGFLTSGFLKSQGFQAITSANALTKTCHRWRTRFLRI